MNLRFFSFVGVLMALPLVGCASPRIISSDFQTVVVAVPDDSNSWPFHYRDEALKKASEQIKDPVLVATNRVKVGETVTQSQDSNKRDISTNKKKLGELTTTTSNTTVRDEYEYYLEFHSRSAANPGAQQVIQTGGVQQR